MAKAEAEVLDAAKIRQDFPILNQNVNGKPLVFLDSAATSQKPLQVIQTLNDYYTKYNSNVHRAAHTLAAKSTEAYENSRNKIANFINAKPQEIIFVKNASEAINLVFYSWALENLKAGDIVVTTVMEHHSNIVPWQQLQSKDVKLGIIDILPDGTLDLEQLKAIMSDKVKLIAVTHCSNVLGTINPVKEI
ncbi:TPA: aminotransferase class V-fold PLP-dependent enzyme, partial [archaeon]|nr:aminotransferase class V-fold PLP-dependent enzyme [Candidatus Naiadarchaeales archaeon SRR2090159.bin1288]